MRNFVWLLPMIYLLAGCVSSSVTKLNPSKQYSTVHPDSVQVFLEESDIECEYEKVALINTKANYNVKSDKSVKKARKKAGEVGANAIILKGFEDPKTGAKIANAFLGTGANKKGEMLAVRVNQSACNDDSSTNQ